MVGDVESGTSGKSGPDGLRVLAVEDLGVVAAEIARVPRRAGCTAVGAVGTLAAGLPAAPPESFAGHEVRH